jgi:hypothetical protein
MSPRRVTRSVLIARTITATCGADSESSPRMRLLMMYENSRWCSGGAKGCLHAYVCMRVCMYLCMYFNDAGQLALVFGLAACMCTYMLQSEHVFQAGRQHGHVLFTYGVCM